MELDRIGKRTEDIHMRPTKKEKKYLLDMSKRVAPGISLSLFSLIVLLSLREEEVKTKFKTK